MIQPRSTTTPVAVSSGLVEIGQAIKAARLRRQRTAADIAGRAGVSLPTYRKIERGDPTVSIGIFAQALWILGLLDNLKASVQPENDRQAASIEVSRLPQRAPSSRRRRRSEVNLDQL